MKIPSFFSNKAQEIISEVLIDLSPAGVEGNTSYSNTVFKNCKFVDTDKWPFFLTDCKFENCQFELHGSCHKYFFTNSIFKNCTLKFVRASNLCCNKGEQFISCKFSGKLMGSLFGNWLDDDISAGHLIDCDFRELKFDLIEFRGKNYLQSSVFANWPISQFKYGPDVPEYFDAKYWPIDIIGLALTHSGKESGALVFDLGAQMENPEELWYSAYDAPFLDFPGKTLKEAPTVGQSGKQRQKNQQYYDRKEKYYNSFRFLQMNASITKIVSDNEDIVLSIFGKNLNEMEMPNTFDLVLKDCSLAVFRIGKEDKPAVNLEKNFQIMSIDVDAKNDFVMIKGHRKALGELCLTYVKSVVVES